MTSENPQISLLSTLLQLEQNARHAETTAELGFTMVNETLRLIPYRQAIFWTVQPSGKIHIRAVSGTDSPDPGSPYVQDFTILIKSLLKSHKTESTRTLFTLNEESINTNLVSLWNACSLHQVLWCPLIPPDQKLSGGLILTRDPAWNDGELSLMRILIDAYSHALWALEKSKSPFLKKCLRLIRQKTFKITAVVTIIAALFIPVRLSVLAPVEIVPLEPFIVSAPMDGVIKTIHVRPDEKVSVGDLLMSMEDTGIRNEYKVAVKALEVVRAEYTKAVQKSFLDMESRAQISRLKAEVDMKEAEAQYADEILQLSKVVANKSGIAVYSDMEDWIGKPVIVGQKVMTIADPQKIEAEILLQVADAINLEPGAEIKIFLNIEPDKPLHAVLKQADYEAHITAAGELAFRLRATLAQDNKPRIGLRGTAKIYGKEVSLFYYLLRRPLTVVRITVGL